MAGCDIIIMIVDMQLQNRSESLPGTVCGRITVPVKMALHGGGYRMIQYCCRKEDISVTEAVKLYCKSDENCAACGKECSFPGVSEKSRLLSYAKENCQWIC